jgi:pseudoazurin
MKYIFIILSGLFFFTQVLSDDVTIEMLNKLGKERMIFSEKIVNVNAGDTVFWKATDKGHNVEFIKNGTPEGVEKFKSKLSEDTKYKFETSGIYAYWCTPHKALGMIGFVIVGDDKSNLDMIKKIRFFGQSKKLAQALIDQI